jgi:hypothetical protein
MVDFILHKQVGNMHHTILGALFNKHLIRGKYVVEIVFEILKKTFRVLILKTNLHIP